MATWDDVRELALAHVGVEEVVSRGSAAWRTKNRQLAWERPLRRADIVELGDAAPQGPVVAFLVLDEGVKLGLAQTEPDLFFTTSHFDGHRIVLARLDALDRDRLAELIEEAWEIAS